ncbi:hypothetical protein Cni_G03040 [Canna indica]|uniref:Uncharacterized protein n=1 Tax=Canna indica TaxID=4628 RepID=A0AAQ3JQG7_9LILI|nr:hypothetical protein Cni_G03040 [Canna indica]
MATSACLLLLCFLLLSSYSSAASPRKLALVQQPHLVLKYHNGQLLRGNYTLTLLFYGRFSSVQRSIIADFIRSLSPSAAASPPPPSVASWWLTTARYAGAAVHLSLAPQLLDESYSVGRLLSSSDVAALAGKAAAGSGPRAIAVVVTAADVAVEGFCSSRCGTHGKLAGATGFVWVGDSASQCPGQCAWPFHQPPYGPQTAPLVAPNGDVGLDGVVINLSALLAGAATNPGGDGYFQGPAEAPLEAVTACTGVFGSGAYPGNPGNVLVDRASGASYNARGLAGRKYLLPAMWDPETSQCSTLV